MLEEPEEPDQIEEDLLNAVNAARAAYATAPPTQKKSSRDAYVRALDKLNAYVICHRPWPSWPNTMQAARRRLIEMRTKEDAGGHPG
jgi:hypothetical protein